MPPKKDEPKKKSFGQDNGIDPRTIPGLQPLQYSATHLREERDQTSTSDKIQSKSPEKPTSTNHTPTGHLPASVQKNQEKPYVKPLSVEGGKHVLEKSAEQKTSLSETPAGKLPGPIKNGQEKAPAKPLWGGEKYGPDKSAEKPGASKEKPEGVWSAPIEKRQVKPPKKSLSGGEKYGPDKSAEKPGASNEKPGGVLSAPIQKGQENPLKKSLSGGEKYMLEKSAEKPSASNEKPTGVLSAPIEKRQENPPNKPVSGGDKKNVPEKSAKNSTAPNETPVGHLTDSIEKRHENPPTRPVSRGRVKYAPEKSNAKFRDNRPERGQKNRKEKHKRRPPIQKSRGRIRHVNDFEKPHWHRPHLLEDLLHFLKRFDEPTDMSKGLMMLTKFGIPQQGRLFDLMFYTDSMPFDFEDYIKLMCSAVVHTWGPLNTGNRYLPASRYIPALQAVRYKGVKMRPDEFVETELLKAVKRRKALEEVALQAEDEAHAEFLKTLTIQQTSSLPLTVMHDILYTQIQIVAKLCEKYTKLLGSSDPNSKVAIAHYNLMQKHLQIFHFMGLRTMPPLYIVRKYEEEPKEENSGITSSSSSEYLDELEDFFEETEEITLEEQNVRQQEKDEDNLLVTEAEKVTHAAAILSSAEPKATTTK